MNRVHYRIEVKVVMHAEDGGEPQVIEARDVGPFESSQEARDYLTQALGEDL